MVILPLDKLVRLMCHHAQDTKLRDAMLKAKDEGAGVGMSSGPRAVEPDHSVDMIGVSSTIRHCIFPKW